MRRDLRVPCDDWSNFSATERLVLQVLRKWQMTVQLCELGEERQLVQGRTRILVSVTSFEIL
jgi:hypothetical protein